MPTSSEISKKWKSSWGGRFTYRGTVIGLDEEKDVAVIQLNVARGGQLPVLAMASELVGPGDDVVAIGYPLSNILGSEPTISRGVVSALRTYIGVEYIQIDAAINPGNSGGPLVNSQGEFVGINTAKLDFVGNIPVEGVGFAISIESFKELLPFLRAGRVARLERTATPTVHRATPTPIQLLHDTDWETYVGEFEQYSIRLAPNWTVEDFDPGSVSLGSPDGRASLVITTFERPHLSLMALIDDLVNTLAEENGEALHITRGPSEIGHPSGVVTFELVFRLEDSLGNSDCFARILAFELNKTKAYVLIGTACGTGSGLNFGDIEVMQNNFLVK
jgi:hypothetical protein